MPYHVQQGDWAVNWNIAEAKQKLPREQRPTMAEVLAEVRRICREENYALEIPPRSAIRRTY
jgi:hypothetical protein